MNPGRVFAFLCCFGVVLVPLLSLEVGLFRLACLLCGVPRPSAVRTLGLVAALLVAPFPIDALAGAVLTEVYIAGGYPLWEAGVVEFFLALPVHLAVCSAVHARMMGVRLADTLAVWFVEKVLKLALVSVCVGFIVLLLLAAKANG